MTAPVYSPTGAQIVSPPNGFIDVASGPQRQMFRSVGGQVTLNGATAVTVSDTSLTATSCVNFSLAVVGGTVGAYPVIKTFTPGTGFTVAGSAGDTSVYNWLAFG